MKYWKDPSEPITAFVKLFETAQRNEEEVRQGFDKIDQLIWFNYTQDGPSCSFHIDCRNHSFRVAAGKPAEEPDLTVSLSADDAHLSWANKLNPVMAIARGKIKVKGSAVGLLRLAPKLGLVAKTYASVLDELGWSDKKALN